MLLTDDLLLYFKRCRRRTFLDIYGELTQQDPEQDFLLKLRQDSHTHRQAVLSRAPYQSPHYPRGDWEAGARATLALMQQGVERISGGILLQEGADGVMLLSRPDLLVKQPGQSRFGDWLYTPTDIKLGKRPKPEYQLVTAFSAQLLAGVQGIYPPTAELILRRQNSYTVNLERWLPLMQGILAECLEIILQRQEPEVFISRQRCNLCHWYSSCHAIARSQNHISLLPGVTPSRYRDLQTLGVTSVRSLAEVELSILERAIGSEVASELQQQARSTVQNRAMLRQPNPDSPLTILEANGNGASHTPSSPWQFSSNGRIPSIALTPNNSQQERPSPVGSLPTAAIELYFDIEAEPELRLDYLLGVVVVDRNAQTERFHALLAEYPTDEGKIWQQFLDLVESYPDAPIFHFSDYETETVKRLGKLYGTPMPRIKSLLSRCVDVHYHVTHRVTLPVESYSLKHLARWIGFEWRDADVSGSRCVCLYNQWLETGDRSLLAAVERYNEDDCRATYHLKNWLVDFLQRAG
jgi:uncharacterized protein